MLYPIELQARTEKQGLGGQPRGRQSYVCTMWENFSRGPLPYHLFRQVGQYHRFDVVLTRVVAPPEDRKGRERAEGC